MPKGDAKAAATKQDIAMLMEQMGKMFDEIAGLRTDNRGIRAEMKDMESRLLLVIEQFHADVNAMYNDKLSQHDVRITRLERHAGLAA